MIKKVVPAVMLLVLAALHGLAWAAWVTAAPLVLATWFGVQDLGLLVGGFYTGLGFGAFIGPAVSGFVIDEAGYRPALALVIAIFQYKPSPFCVLDEVDAALDDVNVLRFTEILRDISKASQFILITHNKQTMGIADHLYGITMDTPGISQVVSVKVN